MRRLSEQARMLFLFAEGEIGIDALAQEFGRGVEPPGATVRIIPGLDHSLANRGLQRVVADQMIGFLKEVFPGR
jgi:hypothetical protein